MDGNGRWANARGLPRTAGHQRGSEAVKRTVKAAGELGVKYLTLFGFSSENWSRPESEVKELMRLLRAYLRSETADLHKNNIRLRVIGDRRAFDCDIIELIDNAENLTADNTGVTLVMALNYGGRQDL
ncbi:MAG TPA: polyprenyl diphosphate synthase, partial [Alphaproteobacteria bacterium]|nr:polyprenyl diphosphate synthase [Alphaproteobacteria bacterium]